MVGALVHGVVSHSESASCPKGRQQFSERHNRIPRHCQCPSLRCFSSCGGAKQRRLDAKPRFQIRNPLLRQEFPWLVSEVVLLLILFNANPPELWFWLVVLLVVLLYRVERWWSSRPNA